MVPFVRQLSIPQIILSTSTNSGMTLHRKRYAHQESLRLHIYLVLRSVHLVDFDYTSGLT